MHMPPLRLRALLIGVLLAVQLVAVAVLVLDTRRDATVALRETAGRTLERFAEQVDESTRSYLEGAEDVLSSDKGLIDTGLIDADDEEALKRLFAVEMRTYPWISSIVLGRTDGTAVYARREDGEPGPAVIEAGSVRHVPTGGATRPGRAPPSAPRDIDGGYDPRERPWYRAARASDGPVWTAPYIFYGEDEMPGISVAVALRPLTKVPSGGIDAGVLAVNLDLRMLSSYVSAVPRTGDGTAALLDASGHVVAYSDAVRFAGAIAAKGLPRLADLGDGTLERLLERHATRLATSAVAPTDREPLLDDERQHLVVVRPFRFGGPGVARTGPASSEGADGPWLLIAQVPFDRYDGVIRERFARGLSGLVVILALSALVGVVAVLGLTRPVYRIHRDATIDRLTGACNRAEFERRVDTRSGPGRHGDGSTLFVVFDLDRFKAVNDTHGHAAGDAVLVEFVRRLKSRLRSSDIVGRLGGDEFVLALDVRGAAADDAGVIEAVRADVVREAVAFADVRLAIGATAGVTRRLPGESVAATLARADRALVAGKAIAKNRTYASASAPDADGAVLARPGEADAPADDGAGTATSDEDARIPV